MIDRRAWLLQEKRKIFSPLTYSLCHQSSYRPHHWRIRITVLAVVELAILAPLKFFRITMCRLPIWNWINGTNIRISSEQRHLKMAQSLTKTCSTIWPTTTIRKCGMIQTEWNQMLSLSAANSRERWRKYRCLYQQFMSLMQIIPLTWRRTLVKGCQGSLIMRSDWKSCKCLQHRGQSASQPTANAVSHRRSIRKWTEERTWGRLSHSRPYRSRSSRKKSHQE